MESKSKDIIFLLGAGASAEAGIPPSGRMIDDIEVYLRNGQKDWCSYSLLYNHIKSGIFYSAGLKGQFKESVSYNIETLVNTLYELERNEEHPLYPFIASWNSRLVTLARGKTGDFERISDFRLLILNQLKSWMFPDDSSLAEYYKGFISLQRGLNFPLRIFSLNYDLCVEQLASLASDFRVETGFGGEGPKFTWDWERFNDNAVGSPLSEIYLYKLHGSINWRRDSEKNLICLQRTESISPEEVELIFGRDFKLEAADPYLFYVYELREYSLAAKLIVSIGYGFGDKDINKILTQALKSDETKRLLVIAKCETDQDISKKQKEIVETLSIDSEKIIVRMGSSKEFLDTPDLHLLLLSLIPDPTNAPF